MLLEDGFRLGDEIVVGPLWEMCRLVDDLGQQLAPPLLSVIGGDGRHRGVGLVILQVTATLKVIGSPRLCRHGSSKPPQLVRWAGCLPLGLKYELHHLQIPWHSYSSVAFNREHQQFAGLVPIARARRDRAASARANAHLGLCGANLLRLEERGPVVLLRPRPVLAGSGTLAHHHLRQGSV
jgi:hypothetical protein